MSIPLSPEQRAAKWGTVAKWVAFAVVGFLVSPFIVATITGMLGLIVAGAIATVAWAATPAIESAAINLRLKLIKQEAARNPIETLQAEYMRRSQLLDERKNAIERFDAKVHTFGDKLAGFKRDYPADAPKYQETYDKMLLLLKRQGDQWRLANKQLHDFNGVIDRAKALYAMACAANEAKGASGLDQDEFYASLKTETALDSITDGMNTAFSQLDTLILESDNNSTISTTTQNALPEPNNNIIDVPFVKSTKKVVS
jgi:hypothetical protein